MFEDCLIKDDLGKYIICFTVTCLLLDVSHCQLDEYILTEITACQARSTSYQCMSSVMLIAVAETL